MKVTVEYTAVMKRATGVGSEEIEVNAPCTVKELIGNVATKHGEALSSLLFDADGVLHPSMLLFVGDDQVSWDSDAELNDGDDVTILSPISGG